MPGSFSVNNKFWNEIMKFITFCVQYDTPCSFGGEGGGLRTGIENYISAVTNQPNGWLYRVVYRFLLIDSIL